MIAQNQPIILPETEKFKIRLAIKREDLLHPVISGNKYRKLKYNLIEAQKMGYQTILTFGGAYSNHILAVAAAGKQQNLNTIGVIRGDELKNKWQDNPTLTKAASYGMQFYFVSRAAYKQKESVTFLRDLNAKFGKVFFLPEGGTNNLAVQGCEEILNQGDRKFNYICTAVGTGGTIAGVVNSSLRRQTILGFPALDITDRLPHIKKYTYKTNWRLFNDYYFGGYAKVNAKLIHFINDFKSKTGIPLDPIYTGKMLYGVLDLIATGYFAPKTHILAIHTGGLQSIGGINRVLKTKNLPLLTV